MLDTILFDLDGTLTDPGEGITNAVRYSLDTYGIAVKDRTSLYRFIGPPLVDSYMSFYGFDREKALEAIERYRVYYRDKGVLENVIYPDTVWLLESLKQAGKRLLVASSKPEVFVKQILTHFGIEGYFDYVSGATLDGRIGTKAEVVAQALAAIGEGPREGIVMVGDREHDVIGAHEHGLTAIGVLWGYGDEEEHKKAGAEHIVQDMRTLCTLLLAL